MRREDNMLFYFTATGNSLYVAKNIDEEVFSIPQELKKKKETINLTKLVLLVLCMLVNYLIL